MTKKVYDTLRTCFSTCLIALVIGGAFFIVACADDTLLTRTNATAVCDNQTTLMVLQSGNLPEASNGQVCVSGHLFQDRDTWFVVPDGSQDMLPGSANILLDLSTLDTSSQTWAKGDVVRAWGQLSDFCDPAEDGSCPHPRQTPTSIVVSPRSISEEQCTLISFEVLATHPRDFWFDKICVDAEIRVEFEGNALYAPGTHNEDRPLLRPSMDSYILAANGFRTFDLVRAEGVLLPSWCEFSGTICLGGARYSLREPAFVMLSRPSIDELCTDTSLADVAVDPDDFTRRIVCTTGTLALRDDELWLVNDGGDETNSHALRLDFLFLASHEGHLSAGDRIWVAGEVFQDQITLHEIRLNDD